MEKNYSPVNKNKYKIGFFQKINIEQNMNAMSKKNIFKNIDIKTDNKIISNNINTHDFFKNKLKVIKGPQEINNQKNLNNIKLIRIDKRNKAKNLSRAGNDSIRFLNGSAVYFQPIFTEISNYKGKNLQIHNNLNETNVDANNNSNTYYQKSNNVNIQLLNKIKILEQKNINNEKMIEKYKIEGNNFINRIQELEKTIKEYEIMNFNDMINSNNKQMEFSLENNEKRNETTKENQNIKNEIKKILNDNNELKLKIKSIEKKIYKNSNEKIFIPQSDNKNNNILKNAMVRNQSFIQKNSAYNKSFRINLLYKKIQLIINHSE